MKKRFLAVMMSAVLAVSVLGGCGSKKADSDTAAQTKAADTKEEETSAGLIPRKQETRPLPEIP